MNATLARYIDELSIAGLTSNKGKSSDAIAAKSRKLPGAIVR